MVVLITYWDHVEKQPRNKLFKFRGFFSIFFYLFLNTLQIGVIYEKSEFRFKIQIISWTHIVSYYIWTIYKNPIGTFFFTAILKILYRICWSLDKSI